MFSHKYLLENVIQIRDCYGACATLVLGKEKALLFDTMCGIGHLPMYLKKLTNLPITVVNSHGHYDHTGGNHWFQKVYMNGADWPLMSLWKEKQIAGKLVDKFMNQIGSPDMSDSKTIPGAEKNNLLPLNSGQCFELGGMKLEAVSLPGHTPGCMGLLCKEKRFLLAGDAVTPVACLFFPESDDRQYKKTLEKVKEIDFDTLILGHYQMKLDKSDVDIFEQCMDVSRLQGPMRFQFEFLPEYHGRLYILQDYNSKFRDPVGIILKPYPKALKPLD